MKKKTQAEHKQRIDELIAKLAALSDDLGYPVLSRINRIADQLQEICGCLYYEHFEPAPMTIQRPFSDDEFKEFLRKSSGRDYQILNEDGKVTMSGMSLAEFMHCQLCPVCYNFGDDK